MEKISLCMKLFFIIAGLKLFSSFEFECDLIKMVYLNIYIFSRESNVLLMNFVS